jgi:alpha-tubulin suppressor-like RCC1 family protein
MAARPMRRGLATLVGALAAACLAPAAFGAQAVQIDAGVAHTCVLTNAGGVQCWGYNNAGQLGDGTAAVRRRKPVTVAGLSSGVTQIATGAAHSCALTTAGGVKCWGDNSIGELGDGTFVERHAPVNVSGLTSGVAAIFAGGINTCAVLDTGVVKCWGDNTEGQVGGGTTLYHNTPVTIAGFSDDVVALDLNYFNVCAVLDSGDAECWGDNASHQVGDGTTVDRHVPTPADELPSGLAHADVGFGFTCALTSGGGASCLGANSGGQLGAGGTTHGKSATAKDVAGLATGVDEIRLGASHACAVLTAGSVRCWGSNVWGELGSHRPGEHKSPFRHRHDPAGVVGLPAGIEHVALGWNHTCAVAGSGEILCWGIDIQGELGDGGAHSHVRPSYVLGYGGAATSTTLTTNRHPSHVGQLVRYTARVRPKPDGGQVHFTDRGKTIKGCGSVPVVDGVARCFVRWMVAGHQHRIRADFWGHGRFGQSSSTVLLDRVAL